ncbi:uroporphyrinogen-III synthase [Helicobacter canadensis]|uniref:Uroporphyrinogen-III synthase n=1 Tax=Helicobacter canadensis MIT 98-5491 TaxID=537970 RepID=C5ZX60_9HELI|nr:uroporphyrinogen-III synthase [Helicobacter canadensis]EES89728.1 uroporphyrinogen-III synthetase [Helicobacter canadensis MIT 98-5491]EFR48521.1 uroporphyrinogen-III synthase [Helicobacter canadensis MIT 98-5491]STO99766.1 uroporphyrinogen-III synthase [Helicobacter canadensis]
MRKVYYITKKNTNRLIKEVEYLELLEICFVEDSMLKQKIKEVECLLFTSKNAVFALEHFMPKEWQNLPCYVIGEGSKKALESLGGKVEFVASAAYGDLFGRELVEILRGKKVLFVRAKKVASNLVEILKKGGIVVLESILYETKILNISEDKKQSFKEDSIFFFSAPSSLRAFLQNYAWRESYLALCIGKSTAKVAEELLGKNAKISLSPKINIKDSLEFAKQLARENNNE